MERINVKPSQGLKILDPRTMRAIPEEGAQVAWSTYWERALQCGDVVLVEKNEEKPQESAEQKTKKMGVRK